MYPVSQVAMLPDRVDISLNWLYSIGSRLMNYLHPYTILYTLTLMILGRS
jgi:hypothetical protein